MGESNIVVKISKDHPQAAKLIKLSEYLASMIQNENGLLITQTCPFTPAEAESLFLELLTTAVDPQLVEHIRERMILTTSEEERRFVQAQLFGKLFAAGTPAGTLARTDPARIPAAFARPLSL